MGADLYIKKIQDRIEQKYNFSWESFNEASPEGRTKLWNDYVKIIDEVEKEGGYFRDSYNTTSVFWVLDLSWWGNILPYVDRDGLLHLDKIREFKELVDQRQIPSVHELVYDGLMVNNENTKEKWHEYFIEKRQKLINFLQRAIDLDSPIYCSL